LLFLDINIMLVINTTKTNFLSHAISTYHNNHIMDMDEINNDICRFKYIVKIINKYKKNNEININLILNHIIICYNVFCPEIEATKLLIYSCRHNLDSLKSLLLVLDRWPYEDINFGFNDHILDKDIKIDGNLIKLSKERLTNHE
jgi:hypothetical protein